MLRGNIVDFAVDVDCLLPPAAVPRCHRGGGRTGPQIVARSPPPNVAVLLTHCGQLILGKISKFDATRCRLGFVVLMTDTWRVKRCSCGFVLVGLKKKKK